VGVEKLVTIWMTNHHPPSVLWHCWMGHHQTCKNIVSQMTHKVPTGTLSLLNKNTNFTLSSILHRRQLLHHEQKVYLHNDCR